MLSYLCYCLFGVTWPAKKMKKPIDDYCPANTERSREDRELCSTKIAIRRFYFAKIVVRGLCINCVNSSSSWSTPRCIHNHRVTNLKFKLHLYPSTRCRGVNESRRVQDVGVFQWCLLFGVLIQRPSCSTLWSGHHGNVAFKWCELNLAKKPSLNVWALLLTAKAHSILWKL